MNKHEVWTTLSTVVEVMCPKLQIQYTVECSGFLCVMRLGDESVPLVYDDNKQLLTIPSISYCLSITEPSDLNDVGHAIASRCYPKTMTPTPLMDVTFRNLTPAQVTYISEYLET